jgi:hypothetical protein
LTLLFIVFMYECDIFLHLINKNIYLGIHLLTLG